MLDIFVYVVRGTLQSNINGTLRGTRYWHKAILLTQLSMDMSIFVASMLQVLMCKRLMCARSCAHAHHSSSIFSASLPLYIEFGTCG